MKTFRFKTIIFLLCTGMAFLFSCDQENITEPKTPSIAFLEGNGYIYTDTVLHANAPYAFGIQCTKGTADLDSLSLYVNNILVLDTVAFNRFSFSFELADTVPENIENIDYKVVITDKSKYEEALSLRVVIAPAIHFVDCEGCLFTGNDEVLVGSSHPIQLDGSRGGARLNTLHILLDEEVLMEVPLAEEEKENGFSGKVIEDISFSNTPPGEYSLKAALLDETLMTDTALLPVTVVPYFEHIFIKLGDVSNPTAGGFFSAHSGEVYSLEAALENAEKLDWLFFSKDNATILASPDDDEAAINIPSLNDIVLNATRFTQDLPEELDFDTVTKEQLEALVIEENLTRIENLTVGAVIAFSTEKGLKGLIRVISVEVNEGQTGFIDFAVRFIV